MKPNSFLAIIGAIQLPATVLPINIDEPILISAILIVGLETEAAPVIVCPQASVTLTR